MLTFILDHGNIQNTDSSGQQRETVGEIMSLAEVATFNELDDTARDAIHDHDRYDYYLHDRSELGIAWRSDYFREILSGHRTIMHGGRIGDRRLGPTREYAFSCLMHKDTRIQFIIATSHAVAKADTTAKWRRPYRAQGFRHLAHEIHALRKSIGYPPTILTGDVNTIGRLTLPGAGLAEVNTPPTDGDKRYDRIYRSHDVTVRGVHTFKTNSDHLALGAIVQMGKR